MRRLARIGPWAAGAALTALTALAATGCTASSAAPVVADPAAAGQRPAVSTAAGPVGAPASVTTADDPTPVVSSPAGLVAQTASSLSSFSATSAQPAPRPTTNGVASAAPAGSGPNVWAVIIGIQDYQSPTHHTIGGDGDTTVFHQMLQRNGWPDSHIVQLVDGGATMANIRGSMRWLVDHSSPGSFTIFHYSGHVCISSAGGCPSGHTFLWSVDNGFMSEQEFGQTMRGLQGMAWVDVSGCESAAFDQGISSPQRLFTAATGPHEKGYEDPGWRESVWTGLLVDQGMLQRKADQNGDGRVSLQEAVRWAQGQAAYMTSNQRPYGSQHPYAVGGTGEWSLTATSPTTQQPLPASPTGGPARPPASPSKPPPSPPTTDGCAGLTAGLLHC
jgi:hypothetical protein